MKIKTWSDPKSEARGFHYWCQGCNDVHGVTTHNQDGSPGWQWNGDEERPVISPSVLTTYSAYPNASEEFKEWRTERRCHTFVGCNGAQPGEVIFLSDCTHAMAGTVQPLLDLPRCYE